MRNARHGEWDEQILCDIGEGVPEGAFSAIDTLFHLAGRAHATDELGADERAYWRVNVEGTRDLFRSARSAGVSRLVFLSSVKATGEGSDVIEDEEITPAPRLPDS